MDELQQNTDHEIISGLRKFRVLILYRFLVSFSTALLISWFLGSIINNLPFVLIVISSSGVLSLILLLMKRNILSSESSLPGLILLSQIIFSVISVLALTLDQPALFIVSSITGLLLLFGFDLLSGKHRTGIYLILYGGQALITGLLIISFLSMLVLPFLFLAALKATSSIYLMLSNKNASVSGIRFLRLMILFFAGFCLLTRLSYPDNIITFIFICGEFIEMILYNYDTASPEGTAAKHIEFNS